MIGNHSRSGKRSAFTLVELMVVILIIAILVSLISSAAMMAMGKIPQVRTSTEIAEMSLALQAFMMDYNLTEPPPSMLCLNEYNPLLPSALDSGRTVQFLQQVCGRNFASNPLTPNVPLPIDWNGDGKIDGPAVGQPWVLQGEQCLVFYLGGIPNSYQMTNLLGTPPGPQGFASNNMNPANSVVLSPKRKGPYFTFNTPRLWPQAPFPGWNGFFVYLDPWQSKTGPLFATMGGSPYAFFSTAGINNAYAVTTSFGAAPYAIRAANPALNYPPTGQYTNPTTFQIISAGKDGVFGTTGWIPSGGLPPVPLSNANTALQPAGDDDQANFSSTLLGNGQN